MNLKNIISCLECTSNSCFIKGHSTLMNHPLIESKKKQREYVIGEYVIRENDPIEGLYFLGNGKIKIFSSGRDGIQQIVRLVHTGESLCFRGWGRTTYLTSSVALENSRICFFESKDFMHVCDISELSMHLITYLTNELDVAEKRLKYLMQMNVREKTAEALLFIRKSFGINNMNELDVYISRKDIAAIAGTSEELIIRQLSEFEKDKIIERRDHGSKIALLNENRLNELITKYTVYL